ncbi:MAG: RluA family pseudouridine synthase [Bacteroidota bacterium]
MIDEKEIDIASFDNSEEESELFEHHRIIVDKGQSLLRIDKFLINRIEGISRNRIQQAAKANCILVNDKAEKQNYKVKPLDVISLVLPHPPREVEINPENIPLSIVFEDEHVIVVDKPAGLVVHPGHANYSGTLLNALLYHLQNTGNPELFPLLVHRIDKNTSGLLVVAKTEMAQTKLAKEFFDHTIKRNYKALVWGDFDEKEGTIEGHIGRSLKDRRVMFVFTDGSYGKHAITHYKIVERFGYVTLIECQLETGRTHQIRAHMKFAGHPIFNDETYGGDAILKGTTFTKYKQFVQNCFQLIPRQALHAYSLGFTHPETGKKLYFESPIPSDMSQVLEKWRLYSKNKPETELA